MGKIKYAIPTSQGIITRTSARRYSHVVVAGKTKESRIRAGFEARAKAAREQIAKHKNDLATNFAAMRADWTRSLGAQSADKYIEEWRKKVPECVAEHEEFLANLDRELARRLRENEESDPAMLMGFASRYDLAKKTAAQAAERYENVRIIEIKPEHMTQVKSRTR